MVGQTCCAVVDGKFPEQKVAILPGFDYENLGRVEGHDVVNKELVPQTPAQIAKPVIPPEQRTTQDRGIKPPQTLEHLAEGVVFEGLLTYREVYAAYTRWAQMSPEEAEAFIAKKMEILGEAEDINADVPEGKGIPEKADLKKVHDVLSDKDMPATAEGDKRYIVHWADGRARFTLKKKADLLPWLKKVGSWACIISIKYAVPEKK